jgi:soluble lytic murein transglycosylase-like protein
MRQVLTTGGAVAALTLAFVLGARSEARFGSLAELRTRVDVQQDRIDRLRAETARLETLVQVREFLDDNRIRLPRETVDRIAGSIHDAATRYEMEPAMILAVIRTESAFNVNALSHKGAVGLMQILPSTAQEIAEELRMDWRGEDLLRDPSANIVMGTYYLTKLLGQFEDMATALTAYNHGPGRVSRMEQARATLPMGYVEKVLSYYTP